MRRTAPCRARGIAALELAILLPVMASLLLVPIGIAFYLWHYQTAYKAALAGARYYATVPYYQVHSPFDPARVAREQAEQLARDALHGRLPAHAAAGLIVKASCLGTACNRWETNFIEPQRRHRIEVSVEVAYRIPVPGWNGAAQDGGWPVQVTVVLPHAGL